MENKVEKLFGMNLIAARNNSIDTVKIIAAFAIIFIHIFPAPEKYYWLKVLLNQGARFAVPLFFISSGYFFSLGIDNGRSPKEQLKKYLLRVGFLYIIWFLIYFLNPDVKVILAKGIYETYLLKAADLLKNYKTFIFYGSYFHMWFLPSLFLSLIYVYLTKGYENIKIMLFFAVILYIFGVLAGSYSGTPIGIQFGFDTRNGIFFSALCVSLGVMLQKIKNKPGFRAGLIFALAGGITHFLEIFILHKFYGVDYLRHDYVFSTVIWSLGIFVIALSQPDILEHSQLLYFGNIPLGLYLIHPLIFCRIQIIQRVLSIGNETLWMIIAPALTILFSVFAIKILGKSRIGRKIIQ